MNVVHLQKAFAFIARGLVEKEKGNSRIYTESITRRFSVRTNEYKRIG